jgi:hypothetical protein
MDRINRVQKLADLLSGEGRRLTFRSGELGRLDFASRIDWQNAFLGEPGEEHPDPGHVLLDAAGEPGMLLDVRRDRDRLDVFQALKPALLRPGQEPANRMIVRNSGVLVADRNSKELEKPFGGLRSNLRNDRGNLERFSFGDGQGRSFHTIWGTFAQ